MAISGSTLEKADRLSLSILHYPFFDLFSRTLKIFRKLPTVVTVHDVIPLRFPEHYPPGMQGTLSYYLQRWALRHTEAVITDSETSKRDIAHYLGVPEGNIHVVPLAPQFVSRGLFLRKRKNEVRDRYGLPSKFILYVGDVNWNKNVATLAMSCAKINVPLVVVGKQAKEISNLSLEKHSLRKPRDLIRGFWGYSHPQLAHLAELKRLFEGKGVIRLGFVPEVDLPVVYSLASAYCQPSFWEGFGLNSLEAIYVGCPVVSSDTPALKELLGEAAIFVDPANYLSVAEGIAKALKPRVAKRLATLGKKRAEAYSWRKTALMTMAVYQKICEQK